jgi:phage tail-like protein
MPIDDSQGRQMLQNLPTPFREDQASIDFVQAFEKVLLGIADDDPAQHDPGIEEIIAGMDSYFQAASAPNDADNDFLTWLAGWMAFSMRADLPADARRNFVGNLATLYRWRGSAENLKRVLAYFTGLPSTASTVKVSATDPYCFEVKLDLSSRAREQKYGDIPRLVEIAHALIRREKPAHTRYTIAPTFPSFRLGSADGTGPFFAQVHGANPADPSKDVGNTLLGVDTWES